MACAVQFGASLFELDKLDIIQPMGQMVGGYVTPIDHGYMFGKDGFTAADDAFAVQSPAKGYVVNISMTRRGDFMDHALTIEFTCTHYVYYSNMTSFSQKLMDADGGKIEDGN